MTVENFSQNTRKGEKMNVEVRKLRPEDAVAYVNFFDATPHDDGVPEHTCYCVNWCSADHRSMNRPDRAERRLMAIDYVKNNILQGYVALINNEIIGWCNANTKADCLNCAGIYFALPYLQKVVSAPEEKVKAVYCFMIAQKFHRHGIARKLLQKICEDAKKEGFHYIEAYPQKDATDKFMQFMGFDELYKSEAFEHFKELEDKYVVRKYL